MGKKIPAALAAFVFVSLGPIHQARADESLLEHVATGSEFLQYCAGGGSQQAACIGYVVGVSDAMISGQIVGNGAAVQACIPREVRGGTRAGTVIRWLANNLDDMNKPAADAVAQALAAAYPCKR